MFIQDIATKPEKETHDRNTVRILGLHVTSSFSKLSSSSGMRGGEFISMNNFSVQEHAPTKNRHILIFRVMAVRDIKL